MKVFISGADGALGSQMQALFKKEGVTYIATDLNQLDIADFKLVKICCNISHAFFLEQILTNLTSQISKTQTIRY